MYQLFCDSNCELWHTVAKEYGLHVIRMPYVLDGKEYYYDLGEATDFAHFYQRMREGTVPTTSAINEQDYIDYFEPVLQEGQDIYYITFSHKLSATFQSMDRAIAALKEKYPEREIRTFDTKSISLGAGFQVRYAAEKYRAGATMDELDAYLRELSAHTVVYFVVDDLTYLYRGGRVSGVSKVVGNLLGIKPILYFNEEGKIINLTKAKGLKKALSVLRDYMRAKGSELDKYRVFVLQADCEDVAENFVKSLKEEFGDLDIHVQPVGPVIGSHCGPGTIGLIFHCSER